jgi:hypothetical protein
MKKIFAILTLAAFSTLVFAQAPAADATKPADAKKTEKKAKKPAKKAEKKADEKKDAAK